MATPILANAGEAGDDVLWGPVKGLALGLCVATLALIVLGYVATREWSHGNEVILEQRATVALALLGAALDRDMRGVWSTLVASADHGTIDEDPPLDLLHRAARTFALFPYPESLIIWRADGSQLGLTNVFNRAGRRPAWYHGEVVEEPFPVVLLTNEPPQLTHVLARIRREASSGSVSTLFNDQIDGQEYQVVAHLLFSSTAPHELSGFVAFTVNLQWVRSEYFGPLLHDLSGAGAGGEGLSLSVVDHGGQVVASSGASPAVGFHFWRPFPLVFIDPRSMMAPLGPKPTFQEWSVHVRPALGGPQAAVRRVTTGAFVLMVLAATSSLIALMLAVNAVRAAARVASMKSDFVSSVTHELKTPIALIRLVSDTLGGGRYTSTATIREYAKLLSQETSRLARSIDNLLTYGKYSSGQPPNPGAVKAMSIGHLVEDTLERFRPRLEERQFAVEVNLPPELPAVMIDAPAMMLALENIVDNAIKYSGDGGSIAITSQVTDSHVAVRFTDAGIGISAEDLDHVFERFFRGRNVRESGSGLGLAIARRIVEAHGGKVTVQSRVDVGTEVEVTLRRAR